MTIPPKKGFLWSRLIRALLCGAVLSVAPVGLQVTVQGGWIIFAPSSAMAKDGDEDDSDSDRRGRGRGDDGDSSNSGSGSGGSDNSGPGGGGSDDEAVTTSESYLPSSSITSVSQVWTVSWVQVNGQDIEVHYTDGWTEVIAGSRYMLIDERNRMAINREVRPSDRDRLAPLYR